MPLPPAAPPTSDRPVEPPPSGNVTQKFNSAATSDADVLRRSLMDRVKAHPTELAAHLNLQLFHFLNDEPAPQLESLEPLAKEQRDMLVTLMDGLKNFRDTVQKDPNSLPSKIVSPLLAMADLLREQTELSVPTIQLCRKVDGYGVYEPMDLTFRAGQEYETIIYCEVENFSSRQNDKLWETKLSMEAVLYNSTGDAILRGKDEVPIDRCRNRRRDFFVVKRLKLPASLSASRYILKVTIVDEQAKRVAENSLTIMMMAQ